MKIRSRARSLRAIVTAAVVTLTIAPAPSAAQPAPETLADFASFGERYFVDIVSQPGSRPGRTDVLIAFRLSFDLMTFRRAGSARQGDAYTATPSFYVEAVAPDGVIADRAQWRDTITVSTYGQTNAKDQWIPGAVALSLRPGIYSLKYTVGDETPRELGTGAVTALRVDDFGSASPAIGLPLFVRDIEGDTLVGTSIGGGAMFGRRLRVFVPLSGADEARLRYDLVEVLKNATRKPARQSGMARVESGVSLGRAQAVDGGHRYAVVRPDTPTGRGIGGALIDARVDELHPGDYLLILTNESGARTVVDTVSFVLRWVEQPVALLRPAYAIRALYPIATEAVVDSLLDLGTDRHADALQEFWTDKDPTPGTAFNEAMAEYYRRVDYAYFNFRSIGQKDGAFTDRGKVYMLFGPPSHVNRQMQPDSHPREVWSYQNRVAQEFVFIDESKTGEYRLVEYHDL